MSTWTVWWWRVDHDYQNDLPVPGMIRYPSLGEAVRAAYDAVQTGNVTWVKVTGPGGETDVRARWHAENGDRWTELSRTAADVIESLQAAA